MPSIFVLELFFENVNSVHFTLCSRFLRDLFTKKWFYVDGETDWEAHKYSATEDQY